VEKILHNLGCTIKEAAVYMALVKLGISTASQISREVSLPRQTVYYILEVLISRELVEQTDQSGVKKFVADPFKIKSLIDKRKHELEADKKKLDTEIMKIVSENYSSAELPKVQFYQGREGLKRLIADILDLYRKGKYKTLRAYGINEFYPGMEEVFDNFVKERHKLGVQTQAFLPKNTDFNKIGGQDTYSRKFKLLDIEYHKAAFYIVGGRIYLFSYKDGVGVVVENTNLANFFGDIFDDQWAKTV
jgi:sugar-specific transcriptional regulator TrmB